MEGGIFMAGTGRKNNWALFLLLLAGIVLGGFIGSLAGKVSFLSWLAYGKSFGFTSPVVLDLDILILTFALKVKINIETKHKNIQTQSAKIIGTISVKFPVENKSKNILHQNVHGANPATNHKTIEPLISLFASCEHFS